MANEKQDKKVNQITSQRIREVMEIRKMRQVDVVNEAQKYCSEKVKFSKSDMSQFYNGKVIPGQDKLEILAQVLNVDEGWLYGLNSNMERNYNEDGVQTQSRTAEFIELFVLLNDCEKDLIIRQIKGLLSSR